MEKLCGKADDQSEIATNLKERNGPTDMNCAATTRVQSIWETTNSSLGSRRNSSAYGNT
jgi:hypothetical protein